jgi:hypothetical protein
LLGRQVADNGQLEFLVAVRLDHKDYFRCEKGQPEERPNQQHQQASETLCYHREKEAKDSQAYGDDDDTYVEENRLEGAKPYKAIIFVGLDQQEDQAAKPSE